MKKLILIFLTLSVYTQTHAQEGNLAEVNGVEIYYEVHGNGDPLVLLHGFTQSHQIWDEWVDDFSKNFQVILVDLRGHGHSTNPTKHFTHRQSAKDIYGLMDVLGIENFEGIGFSSGGMTLTHMAAMDSTRIRSMVLIGSTSYYPEQTRTIQRGISYETLPDSWINEIKPWHPRGEPQIRMLINQFHNFSDTYEDMNFTPPYLTKIQAKTLIIHGDRDPFFPVEIPVTSYKSIPNSYLWIIPNYNHSPFEKGTVWGDAFLAAIHQFLSGEWDE